MDCKYAKKGQPEENNSSKKARKLDLADVSLTNYTSTIIELTSSLDEAT